MITPEEIKKVQEMVEEFLQKMTLPSFSINIQPTDNQDNTSGSTQVPVFDAIDVNIALEEPQMLIGQNGQTLFELQHILKILLSKKLQKPLYVVLDINDYKKKKIEYLKNLAKELADEVSLTKEKKVLPSMPAYERRIIHMELAKRQDIITESQGEGTERYVVINPR